MARLYGLARAPQLGLRAFSANVPRPASHTELAADAIGQGRLTFSALGMAQVAAAIDSGLVRPPRLVQGASDDRRPPSRLPGGLVADLRAMMANVTTRGNAAGTGLPAGPPGWERQRYFGFVAKKTHKRLPAAAVLAVAVALSTTACGGSGPGASHSSGAQLFVSNCGSCHTLAAAGTRGTVGPDLDKLLTGRRGEDLELVVRDQIDNGGGSMPAGILTDGDADAVAAYVASAVR